MSRRAENGLNLDLSSVREVNTKVVLNLLRSGPELMSRQQLAEDAGLSLVTIGKIVRRLERSGFVKEVATDRQGTGRPVGLLEFQTQAGFVLGILTRANSIDGVIMDLSGRVQHARTAERRSEDGGADIVEEIAAFTEAVIAEAGIGRHRIFGVGLGFPGLIDATAGRCIDSWALGLTGVDLVEPLERRLGFPVLLDNDVNCLGTYEVLFGHLHQARHGLLVSFGKGIGMAVIVDGLVYRGAGGMAGDFGHSAILGADRNCECGRRGCLEAYCSDRGIVRNYQQSTGDTRKLEEIITQARAGEPASMHAVAEAGRLLGLAIGTAVLTLDPAQIAIVLMDGAATAADLLRGPILDGVGEQLAGRPTRPSVELESIGYERWAEGAGSLALAQFFTPGAMGFTEPPPVASH